MCGYDETRADCVGNWQRAVEETILAAIRHQIEEDRIAAVVEEIRVDHSNILRLAA